MIFKKKGLNQAPLLRTLRHFTREICSIIHIKDLLKGLLKAQLDIAEGVHGSLWLCQEKEKSLELRESLGGDPLVLKFNLGDPFVNFLSQTRGVFTKRQLVRDANQIDIKEAGLKFMTAINGEVLFPLVAEKKFIGLLVLGPRRDGKPYSPELLELIEILSALGAVSIDNALLYDSLSKQNLKLSEIAKLKTQFVSTVTHELSTPLNGILGLTEVLLNPDTSGPLNDDQKRYLQMIQSASQELHEMVEQIIDLTRFQSKQGALEVKKIDFSKTVNGIYEELKDLIDQRGIVLAVNLDPKLKVYGDEGQIRQVITSLMENALKFSEGGVQPKTIEVEANRHGDMLKVCVSDQGIGIAEEDQELIFEDFRQADGEATRVHGGTGLGLALAKKIVELHGGRIWVESKKGEGSQFYFTLPLKPGLVQAKELDTGRH